jgi:hypothetical protein
MKEKLSFARKVGVVFAVIQGFVDELFGFFFRKLKQTGAAKPKDPKNELEKFLRGVSRFFGELGDAFYTTYEKIKKDKKD